jgi:hypothetical protein
LVDVSTEVCHETPQHHKKAMFGNDAQGLSDCHAHALVPKSLESHQIAGTAITSASEIAVGATLALELGAPRTVLFFLPI